MTFDEACRIGNPRGISFQEKMDRYVRHIGRDGIRPHLPAPVNVLAREYLSDRNFNGMKLSAWERAAGYPGFKDGQGGRPPVPFPELLYSRGVTCFTMSEAVSVLKHAAELDVRDYLRDVLSDDLSRPMEFWAVFEHCDAGTDRMNRHNIFDFDCVAGFRTEPEAMAFESENRGRRVRKLVKAPAPKNETTEGET